MGKQKSTIVGKTTLEKEVLRVLKHHAGTTPIRNFVKKIVNQDLNREDIAKFLAPKDLASFFRRHRKEIGIFLEEVIYDSCLSPNALFHQDEWDKKDIFAQTATNQAILAHFGFKQIVMRLHAQAEWEAKGIWSPYITL